VGDKSIVKFWKRCRDREIDTDCALPFRTAMALK
jgi:hypothetical protein